MHLPRRARNRAGPGRPAPALNRALLGLFLLLSTQAHSAVESDPCDLSAGQHFCGACTKQEGCFWCENTRTCANYSTTTLCADSQVIKESSKCPTCANALDCTSCITSPVGDCGWCTSAFSCVSSKLLANGSACPDSDYVTVDAACPVNPLVDQTGALSPQNSTFIAPDKSYLIDYLLATTSRSKLVTALNIPDTEYCIHINLASEAGKCGGVGCRILITGSDSNPFCICFGVSQPTPDDRKPDWRTSILPLSPSSLAKRIKPAFSAFKFTTQDFKKGVELHLGDFCPGGGVPAVLKIMCRPGMISGQPPQIAVDNAFLLRPPICGGARQPTHFVMELYGSIGCRHYILYPPSGVVSVHPDTLTMGQPEQEVKVSVSIKTTSQEYSITPTPWIADDARMLSLSVTCGDTAINQSKTTLFVLTDDNKFEASFFLTPSEELSCSIDVRVNGPLFSAKIPGHTGLLGDPSAILSVQPPDATDWWKYTVLLVGFASLLVVCITAVLLVKHGPGRLCFDLAIARIRLTLNNRLAPPSPTPREPANSQLSASGYANALLPSSAPAPPAYQGFICYNGQDRAEFAAPLQAMLQATVPDFLFFYDRLSMNHSSGMLDASIADALHSARIAIVIITPSWFTRPRKYPVLELCTLLRRSSDNVMVIPVLYGLDINSRELRWSGLSKKNAVIWKNDSSKEFIARVVACVLIRIKELSPGCPFAFNSDIITPNVDPSVIVQTLDLEGLYKRSGDAENRKILSTLTPPAAQGVVIPSHSYQPPLTHSLCGAPPTPPRPACPTPAPARNLGEPSNSFLSLSQASSVSVPASIPLQHPEQSLSQSATNSCQSDPSGDGGSQWTRYFAGRVFVQSERDELL